MPPEGSGLGFTEDSVQSHIEILLNKESTESKFEARLLLKDFVKLKDFFEDFEKNLSSKKKFWFSEGDEYITLDVQGDGLGNFTSVCNVNNVRSNNLSMCFDLTFDQTQIAPMVTTINQILQTFSK